MNATNTSSTKSPKVWQATLRTSKLFAAIYAAALGLSLLSLWHCPVEIQVRILLIVVTLIGGTTVYLDSRRQTTLSICEDNSWHISDGTQQYQGHIARGCYRSTWLVVVAIKPECERTQYVAVWRDSVSPTQFSALHIKLALTPASQLA